MSCRGCWEWKRYYGELKERLSVAEHDLAALASMVDAAGLADRPQSETGESDFQRIASGLERAYERGYEACQRDLSKGGG